MKKHYLLLLTILFATFSFAQGSEDFANSTATSSYSDGSFTGNNGVTWTYVQSRDGNGDANGSGITLPALMLRRVSSSSKITSSTVSGGIGDFSVKLYRGFTSTSGGGRQVELFVNGVSKGTSTPFTDTAEHVFSVTGINVGGDVVIELKNINSKQIIIDDITWTAYAGAATPSLNITSPTSASTEPTGDVTVSIAVSNFTVGNSGGAGIDGHIHWTLDGVDQPMKYDTNDIALTGLSAGSHTVYMKLVDNSHADLSPNVDATVTFSVQSYTQVADIAALRAGTVGDSYELTGEALINFAQSFRNQKWIQDATGGVLIDDNSGIITAGVAGDGLSGIKGVLGEYQGMIQFVPSVDATLTSPSTVTITPQVVTLANLTANGENYEAILVKIEGVTLADTTGGDGNFANGKEYPMTQGADGFDFRTNFYSVDYIGSALPTGAQDIVGLIKQATAGYTFTARNQADFLTTASVAEDTIDGFTFYPNPVKNGFLSISTSNNIEKSVYIYNLLGKQVFRVKTSNNTLINISSLNTGIYILKVIENGKTATRKLVIQ